MSIAAFTFRGCTELKSVPSYRKFLSVGESTSSVAAMHSASCAFEWPQVWDATNVMGEGQNKPTYP
jgi:hypothetical protein